MEILRNDLEQLYKWSEDWQMLFNLDKCVVIHMGNKNKKCLYELGGQKLKSVEQERDLYTATGKYVGTMYYGGK